MIEEEGKERNRWFNGGTHLVMMVHGGEGTHPLDPQLIANHQEIAIHIGEDFIIAERPSILGWACHIFKMQFGFMYGLGTSGDG